MQVRIGYPNQEIRAKKTVAAKVEYAFGNLADRQEYIQIKRRESARVWELEKQMKTE